jgi:hypothetical protein
MESTELGKELEFKTPLCEIAYKYGTDKCPQIGHNYTPFYYDLLKDKRESFKKVVELGIGTRGTMGKRAVPHYVTGASLYMWRDFFPNAQIFGADFMGNALFQSDRIKTFFCDERQVTDLKSLVKNIGNDVDLFIDDASHAGCHQVFACVHILPLLKKDVIYIIEDVGRPEKVARELKEVYGYDCQIIKHFSKVKYDNLVIVRK